MPPSWADFLQTAGNLQGRLLGLQTRNGIPATACDIPLSCKRPALWEPGAIPTVDFLLHHCAASVKKMGVKTHDDAHAEIPATARRAGSSRRVDPGFHHH